MPGTNHHIDTGFMNELTLSLRTAAEDLLKHNTLKQLLTMRKQGVTEFLQQNYPFIREEQWRDIINKVLLTKISYFELNSHFSSAQLDKLLDIAQLALGLPDPQPKHIYKHCEYRYPVFANVIKTILVLKQQKHKSTS